MTVIETIDLARDLLNEQLDSGRSFPDNSSSFYSDQSLLGYFNREQQIVQQILVQAYENYFVTSTTISITNDTEEYAMSSGVMKIVRVEWIGDNSSNPIEIYPMSFNEKEYFQGLRFGISSVGDVRTYAIKGGNLVFRPTPKVSKTDAIKYYYIQKLPDLSSGTSTSPIPEQFHEVIGWGIYKRALIQEEASQEAVAIALNEYNRLVSEMRQWAEDRQIQRPRFVKRRNSRRLS